MFRVFDNNDDIDIVLGKFIAYMDKALLHRRINYLKHQKFLQAKECKLNKEEWEVLSIQDDTYCSSFCLQRLEEIFEDKHISKAFKKLTALQQKIMYLNVVDEIPMSAISKILKISTKSVEKAKSRALNNLKKYLEVYKDVKKD